MIAINLVLMITAIIAVVSSLSWAIINDRRSPRAAGGRLPPAASPLRNDLIMPRALRTPLSAN